MLATKVVILWAFFIPIAILNGGVRERGLVPLLGERLAQPLSGLTGSALFFFYTWFTLPWLAPLSASSCLLIGACWLLLTIIFEFSFGLLVAHKPWQTLLHAYNPLSGNLWSLVLAVITLAPYLVARMRGW